MFTSDILWSDPIDTKDGKMTEMFSKNQTRNCSYFFGEEATSKLLQDNELVSIIRAHEAQPDGFKLHEWSISPVPPVVTIFSAPNYCDIYNNKAAIIQLESGVMTIQQFSHSPHPFVLPNFMNIIEWSLPFVSEKSNLLLIISNRNGIPHRST